MLILTTMQNQLSPRFRFWQGVKRVLDWWVASISLLLLAPGMGLIAIGIYVSMGCPIFFRQPRPGKDAQIFTLYKFRTMSQAEDAAGNLLPDAQRLTRFGQFLRKTSLDELPQLWNVWKGEMSLVGPRPLLVEYLARYTPTQARRHQVKPGITGWAQVNGRNALTWEQKFALDVWYVDHWQLGLDGKILLMTIAKVWQRQGISHPDHVTMTPFMGTLESDSSERLP